MNSSSMHILDRLEQAALMGVHPQSLHDCDQLTVESGCWLLDTENAHDPFHGAVTVARTILLDMVNDQFGSGNPSND